jgi:hypothetical protein
MVVCLVVYFAAPQRYRTHLYSLDAITAQVISRAEIPRASRCDRKELSLLPELNGIVIAISCHLL